MRNLTEYGLKTLSEHVAWCLVSVHPSQRAALFGAISDALLADNSLTLAVTFEKVKLEYESIINRNENQP